MGDCEAAGAGGRTVLVALDESENSLHALEWLLQTFRSSLDKLVLLHANTLTSALGSRGYMVDHDLIVSMEASHDMKIREFLEKALLLCHEKQVAVEVKVESGDPRYVICDMADKVKADFLVMGSHGHGAMKRVMLGSVSDYCAHHAKCPVLIVKNPHHKK